jgi:hypothetical protein
LSKKNDKAKKGKRKSGDRGEEPTAAFREREAHLHKSPWIRGSGTKRAPLPLVATCCILYVATAN